MAEDTFEKRIQNFRSEGELVSFNLAAVAEALDTINDLNEKNIGGETVERRIGEYKSWDPEIFKVDKDTENGYIKRLREIGNPVILLSEEVEKLEINLDKPGQKMYVISDPFDGSYLFKRGIQDFWYSSLAFYDENFNPISCVVGDNTHRILAFATERGAFIAKLSGDTLIHKFELNAEYRDRMGRKEIKDLEGASIESYAMKPSKYLIPLIEEYKELLRPFKFFMPNGGPYGFVDVAEGKIDVYFARSQPFVDVFSGIFIAKKAGAVITDFEGNPVRCTDNIKSVYNVVVTTNRTLHDKVLEKIRDCKKSL